MNAPRNIGDLLNKLTHVKPMGEGSWAADCPCPGHETPSGHFTIKDGGDKALVTCFSVHTYDDICKALGFDSLTYAKTEAQRRERDQLTISAVYPYQDEGGKVLFEVVRFLPKTFRQRKPDGTWGLQGVTPTIYHLPEVKAAIAKGETIYICEGEKDADNLRERYHLTATTNPMGAGKWRDNYSKLLVGAKLVVIFPDNDKPGRNHGQQVAESLNKLNIPCKLLDMPRLEIKDVTDWLNDGLTPQILQSSIQSLPPWQPPQQVAVKPNSFNKTDLGNAERLVKQYGDILRYCYERKMWLIWKGNHWKWDEGGEVMRMAQRTVRTIYEEAAEEDDENERKKLADWAKTSESNQRLNAMVSQAQPLTAVHLDELDANYWLLNCKNGTIDLHTGELREHKKEDYQTLMCPYDYDPALAHPIWDTFLARVCNSKTDIITYLQRSIGYSLTGDTSEQVLFFAHGQGQNGKSTFLETFIEIMGPYSAQANIEMFLTSFKQGNAGHSEDVANLAGKRFVVASEIEEGRRLAVPKLKQMTGGEKVRASHKYEHEFEYQVTYKIWLNGNHKPEITDTTFSIWRRVKMIPFDITIPPNERDRRLREKLRAEYPAILAWAVQGCIDWQSDGLKDPQEVTDAVAEYRQEQDFLMEFFHAKCFLNPKDAECTVSHKELFTAYQSWCADNSTDPVATKTFAKRLKNRRDIRKFESSGQTKWRFIRLLKTGEDQQPAMTVDEVVVVDNFHKSLFHEENIGKKGSEQATLPTSPTSNVTVSPTIPTSKWVQPDISCPKCSADEWLFREDGTPYCNNCGGNYES